MSHHSMAVPTVGVLESRLVAKRTSADERFSWRSPSGLRRSCLGPAGTLCPTCLSGPACPALPLLPLGTGSRDRRWQVPPLAPRAVCPLPRPPPQSASMSSWAGEGGDGGQRPTGPYLCSGRMRRVSSDPDSPAHCPFLRVEAGRACRPGGTPCWWPGAGDGPLDLGPRPSGSGSSWSESGLDGSYFCHNLVLSPKPGFLNLFANHSFSLFLLQIFTSGSSCLGLHVFL